MDWQALFFSPDGRIGRPTFWIGWLVLLGVNVVMSAFPPIGWLINLVTIYCWVCVSNKRLHDMGKSGWLNIIPLICLWILPVGAMFAFGGMAIFVGLADMDDSATLLAILGSLGGMLLVILLSLMIALIFLIWEGVANGDPGENRYGAPPASPSLA